MAQIAGETPKDASRVLEETSTPPNMEVHRNGGHRYLPVVPVDFESSRILHVDR